MCFTLYIASNHKAPRLAWDEKERHLSIADLHANAEAVRLHFTLSEVAYVGSDINCGCGFRSVTFQDGWPGEWLIEQGEVDPPDNHMQNHQELYNLVASLFDSDLSVELYGCWNGDERDQTEIEEQIPPSRLLETNFWFRERCLYRITNKTQSATDATHSNQLRRAT